MATPDAARKSSRLAVLVVGVAVAGCGGAPAARSPAPSSASAPAPSLEHSAFKGFENELRVRGYRLGKHAESAKKASLVASRDGRAWYFTLRVESSRTFDGHKFALRLGVFTEPRRTLRGEIGTNANAVGADLAPEERTKLARRLGRRAAAKFAAVDR